MQKKIAIASVLKPVDDTRLYEKMAVSLADTGDFHVDIIGFRSSINPNYNNISFYPVFCFQRLHPMRLFSGLRLLKLLVKLKPDLLIITTHELLFAASLYKLLYGKAVIYDVCENYYGGHTFTAKMYIGNEPYHRPGWRCKNTSSPQNYQSPINQ